MLKQQARVVASIIYAADLAVTLLSLPVAYILADWGRINLLPRVLSGRLSLGLYPLQDCFALVLPIVLIWTALLFGSGAYKSHRTASLPSELLQVGRVALWGSVFLTLVVFAVKWDWVSRLFLILFPAVNSVAITSERLAVRAVARYVRMKGFNYRTVLVVGNNERAHSIGRLLKDRPWWGFRVLGVVREGGDRTPELGDLPVIGTVAELPELLTAHVVDEAVFCIDRASLEKMEDVFLLCEEMGIRTRVALDFFPHVIARVELEELDGVPLLTFSTTPGDEMALLAKRAMDVALAAALLVLSVAPIALAALLIKLTSRGRILFRQTRCGLNGRRFTLYKLRTMVEGAEEMLDRVAHLNEMNGPVFKVTDDPRVTTVGRFLRRFSLDEVPQLWNVLQGDMSLVGPRPPIPDEVDRYERWQRRRLSMKPGVTGLWQVSGRNEIASFDRWMELDLDYIDNWSLGLDLKILARTIPAVLSGRGAR